MCIRDSGLEFEVCWIIPKDLLDGTGMSGVEPLDLDKEIARFGAETLGGIGISWPAT